MNYDNLIVAKAKLIEGLADMSRHPVENSDAIRNAIESISRINALLDIERERVDTVFNISFTGTDLGGDPEILAEKLKQVLARAKSGV